MYQKLFKANLGHNVDLTGYHKVDHYLVQYGCVASTTFYNNAYAYFL